MVRRTFTQLLLKCPLVLGGLGAGSAAAQTATHESSKRCGFTSFDHGVGVAVNAGGEIYVTGDFSVSVSFGGPALSSVGSADIFVAKFDDGGGHLWSQRFGGTLSDVGWAIACRDTNAVTVAGGFQATADFCGGDVTSASGQDFFVARHDADGAYRWCRRTGGTGSDIGSSVAAAGTGAAVVTGSFSTSIDFGGGALAWSPSAADDFDYFVVYGSGTASFADAAVIGYTTAPGLDVSTSPHPHYFVTAVDFAGNESGPAAADATSGVGDAPPAMELAIACHPNPFNPLTNISYAVPRTGLVTVVICDARGARVTTLVDGVERTAGIHRQDWGGRADSGQPLPSGIYFAHVRQDGAARTVKISLVR